MIINLETDFIRYETDGVDSYWGYAKIGTTGSQKEWSIRKITATGGSSSQSWNLNTKFSYTAIWDNKELHFSTFDASFSTNFTYSISDGVNSWGISSRRISMGWDEVPGADQYQIIVSDNLGVIYDRLGNPFKNPYVSNPITDETKSNSFYFIGVPTLTYSVSLFWVNGSEVVEDSLSPFVI
jgi:hypothetical protein